MATIINYFRSNNDKYAALQKKDDDLYIKALQNWYAKYQIENVDNEKKVEIMIQELSEIPTETLTIPDINRIGKVIHEVAFKRVKYKEMLIEMLRKIPNCNTVIQMWLDKVYLAFPTKI